MAHVSQAHRAAEALKERKFDEAIDLYTKATVASKAPSWLLGLAQAQQQKKDIASALKNTTLAYNVALERANRAIMIDAQYRRAVLLYRAGRYADADVAAVWSQMLVEGVSTTKLKEYPTEVELDEQGHYIVTMDEVKSKEFKGKEKESEWDTVQNAMGGGSAKDGKDKKRDPAWTKALQWRLMVLGALDKLSADDPVRKVTIKPAEDNEVVSAAAAKVSPAAPTLESASASQPSAKASQEASSKASETTLSASVESKASVATSTQPSEAAADAPVDPEKLRPRVDFYQAGSKVTVTVMMKAQMANTNALEFAYGPQQVRLAFVAHRTRFRLTFTRSSLALSHSKFTLRPSFGFRLPQQKTSMRRNRIHRSSHARLSWCWRRQVE
jgi:suppressor of G2 allele of SKP1